MKTNCKGKCGKEKAAYEIGVGGNSIHKGDKMIEWVCEDCLKNGVRLSFVKDSDKENGK